MLPLPPDRRAPRSKRQRSKQRLRLAHSPRLPYRLFCFVFFVFLGVNDNDPSDLHSSAIDSPDTGAEGGALGLTSDFALLSGRTAITEAQLEVTVAIV